MREGKRENQSRSASMESLPRPSGADPRFVLGGGGGGDSSLALLQHQ